MTAVTPLIRPLRHSVCGMVLVLAAVAAVAGCKSNDQDAAAQQASFKPHELPAGSFMVAWRAPLPLSGNDQITHVYRLGDQVIAYSRTNRAYVLSAAGGQILWGGQITSARERLLPPVRMKDLTLFPTSSTLELWKDGRKQRSIGIGHALRSPVVAEPESNYVYAGLDYPIGGRLAQIDISRSYNVTRWELMTRGGLSAAPVFYQQAVFAGGEDGAVYALNEDRDPIWSTPGNIFQTDGPIVGDLKADDYALYVASGDSKLYALDRSTGKIKWQYFAGAALTESPAVTADSVYQAVPIGGVAALDKSTGAYDRSPRWQIKGTVGFLAEDAATGCVYLRRGDNSIVGVDKKTGEIRYESRRKDLEHFVANTTDGTVFAVTRKGTVLAIHGVPRAGIVGEQARGDEVMPPDLKLASAIGE